MKRASHFVSRYVVKFHETRNNTEFFRNGSTEGFDPREFFENFFTWVQAVKLASEDVTQVNVAQYTAMRTAGVFYGYLKKGEVGREFEVFEPDGSLLTRVEQRHLVETGYFFYVQSPIGRDFSVVSLYKIGSSGCKSDIENAMRSYLSIVTNEVKLTMQPLFMEFDEALTSSWNVSKFIVTQYEPLSGDDQAYFEAHHRPKIGIKYILSGKLLKHLLSPANVEDPAGTKAAMGRVFRKYASVDLGGTGRYEVEFKSSDGKRTKKVPVTQNLEVSQDRDITDQIPTNNSVTNVSLMLEIFRDISQETVDEMS